MSEWKNGKAVVYEDRHGNTRCGACCAPLWCNDCGDMPESCPQCGAPLDYSGYSPSNEQMNLFEGIAAAPGAGSEPATQPITEQPAEAATQKSSGAIYYPIDENTARRAHDMVSMSDYKAGSATAEYRAAVDKAAALVERCKASTSPYYHNKLDTLLDRYARRLADNINARNRNTASCPSVMIAGPANFPTRKKARQNAREDSLMREYQEIQHILHQIRTTGTGGIQSGDPEAVRQLEEKLARLEQDHAAMKAANSYYRKHKTLDGCPGLTPELARHVNSFRADGAAPFSGYPMQLSLANIKRTRQRLEEMKAAKSAAPVEQETPTGVVYREDPDAMRVQLVFSGKPDADTRALLKSNGFRWAPSVGAWQRQLTESGKAAARRVLDQLLSE